MGVVWGVGCSSAPPVKKDLIQAKTTTRDANEGESFESAPKVENAARSQKQQAFLAGQKAYDIQDYAKAIPLLSSVVNDKVVDEMNYFAASLLFDALAKEKNYPELCGQLKKSSTQLCGSASEVKPDQLEFCKDLYNVLDSCAE